MIIEAGYDIHQVLMPTVLLDAHEKADERRPLYVMSLDADLRLEKVSRVERPGDGHPHQAVAGIVEALRDDCDGLFAPVHIVLAWYAAGSTTSGDGCTEHRLDEGFRDHPDLSTWNYLGHAQYDDDTMIGTFPRFSFRDYPQISDFPRPALFVGPHDYDCACLACAQYQERFEQRTARRARVDGQGDPADGRA